MKDAVNIVWLRRDLRLHDHSALYHASENKIPVLLLFIFDEDIVNKLEPDDSRISFIYDNLWQINDTLKQHGSAVLIKKGKPIEVWKSLLETLEINAIFANEDYEPYGLKRDREILDLCATKQVPFNLYKDHVIFAKDEVVKKDGQPYTVFTPYKHQWLKQYALLSETTYVTQNICYVAIDQTFPSLQSLGFERGKYQVRDYDVDHLDQYKTQRDLPYSDSGSYIGPHLRFGTTSIRSVIKKAIDTSETYLSELIWREFFMQVLYHFPQSANSNFKTKYDWITWRNQESDFEHWCNGTTGYPFVDAGMRQLNQTGYMHNRVRMITASFLCKHLLINWQWGEAYFAAKLLDYELSSNMGNWQWAAGTGCDAAPYFRVFNPTLQQQKFDSDFNYIKKWIPEFGTDQYPKPIIEHAMARDRALKAYKTGIANYAIRS